jgi:hypothetical protein
VEDGERLEKEHGADGRQDALAEGLGRELRVADVDPEGEQPRADHECREKCGHAPDPAAESLLDSSSQWWFITVLDRAGAS